MLISGNLVDPLALALQCYERGQFEQAEAYCRRVLKTQPKRHEALQILFGVRFSQGDYRQALALTKRAVAADSKSPQSHNNMGLALGTLGRHEEALICYQKALALRPQYPQALNNRGNALASIGRFEEALASYDSALAIEPLYVEALYNRGSTLNRMNRHEEAIPLFEKTLSLKPQYFEALNNLGVALFALNRCEEALIYYGKALELRPDYAPAHSDYIFMLDYLPGKGTEVGTGFREHQEERRRWHERHAARFASQIEPHANDRNPNRKLRIGYISPYMMRNSFGTWLFRPLIRKHDRSQFEVFLYSDVKTPDGDTQSFRDTDSVWREAVHLNDEALASLIRKDRIDILVDLTGHASANRLLAFARKPAPVQVSAWGHPTGTGLPVMDYLFADPVAVPEEVRPLFAEKIFDLPCFLGYEPPEYAPEVVAPPSADGRPVTFGCLNRLSKITERCLALWSELLREVPDARLVLKDPQLAEAKMQGRITKAFTDRGINSDRLELLASTPHDQHLAAYNTLDIALDPFPQSGGVSTFEALWMGVPVVALLGPSVSGRGAASILSSLGLQDWVAETEEAYLALAKRKASDIAALAALRPRLRPLMAESPAGDPSQYTRAVEAAYRAAWRSHCLGGEA